MTMKGLNVQKRNVSGHVSVGPLKQGDELVTDDKDMATILNNQFSFVFTHEGLTTTPKCANISNGHSVEKALFDVDMVKRKIKKLKISFSSGPDGISSKFLLDHVDILS